MESAIDFYNLIINSMSNFADNSDKFFERVIVWLAIAWLHIKMASVELTYSIASTIIESAGISEVISTAWGNINSEVMSVLVYLRIPEAVNLILSSVVTRFILGMLP